MILSLLSSYPGWKEPNIPTLNQMILCTARVSSSVLDLPLRLLSDLVPPLVDRLSEPKLQAAASEALLCLAEGSGVRGVSHLVGEHVMATKRVGVQAMGNSWLVSSIESFGCGVHDVSKLASYTHKMLQNTNPEVRASTLSLAKALARHVGPSFKDMLAAAGASLLKPMVQKQVEAALSEVRREEATASEPTRQGRSTAEAATLRSPKRGPASGSTLRGAEALQGDGSESGVMRGGRVADDENNASSAAVDISGSITSRLLKLLASPDWKNRREAVSSIARVYAEVRGQITPKVAEVTLPALRLRLHDTNQSVMLDTISLVGFIAKVMGSGVAPCSKLVMKDLLLNIGDKKAVVREKVRSHQPKSNSLLTLSQIPSF